MLSRCDNVWISKWSICILIAIVVFQIEKCSGHGRLIEPPSRASAWRYGFQTPPDYNDHELYCGGFTRQWKRNGGKCGECGDAWDMPMPRPHENGGQWGQGVIVRKYAPGSEMTIRVELTASHMGYFEFRLCPEPSAKQDCLDRHLLVLMSGTPAMPSPSDLETRFYPRNGSRIYDIKAQLPDMICDQCVLQWRYVAGNNWGMCPDGNGAVGCGPQEEFRSCSDVALGEGAHTPIRPFRPTMRTTVRPKVFSPTTESNLDGVPAEEFNYVPSLVIGIVLFLVLCGLLVWYLYRYQGEKVKAWMVTIGSRFCRKQSLPQIHRNIATINNLYHSSPDGKASPFNGPPVPPPRVKRHSRVQEMSPEESSIA